MGGVGAESVLFKNVTIVTSDDTKQGDVLVKDGKIAAIGPSLPEHAEVIINEKGLALFPGVIDPHVHFRDPGVTHKESIETGSRAAASGGTTSFFDMPNTLPSAITAERIQGKKDIAAATSLINYNFFIGATPENLDELNLVENVPGIKIFVGSSTGNLLVDKDKDLIPIFQNGSKLIAVHSEDEAQVQANAEKYASSTDVKDFLKIRTVQAAIDSTKRLVRLAREYNRRLHICHLTTAEEAEFLASDERPSCVTTEVTPQHLFLWAPDVYDRIGTFAQINPPIREKRHADALFKALKAGVIQNIGTDHAPHLIEEKEQPFGKAPSGMPGVETSLPLMLTLASKGHISLQDIVRWMCENPANVFRIQNKGKIEVGYDADLVLVDLEKKKTIENANLHTKCKWSAFEGWETTGVPVATFVNGNMVYRENDFFDEIKGKEVQINP